MKSNRLWTFKPLGCVLDNFYRFFNKIKKEYPDIFQETVDSLDPSSVEKIFRDSYVVRRFAAAFKRLHWCTTNYSIQTKFCRKIDVQFRIYWKLFVPNSSTDLEEAGCCDIQELKLQND